MQLIEVNYKEYDLLKLFIYGYLNECAHQNQVENFPLCYTKFSLFTVCSLVNVHMMWSKRTTELLKF